MVERSETHHLHKMQLMGIASAFALRATADKSLRPAYALPVDPIGCTARRRGGSARTGTFTFSHR